MNGRRTVGIIDQTTGMVATPQLANMAAALQHQVDRDLSPAWGLGAQIMVPPAGSATPEDLWPVYIVDELDGAAGVHLDQNGQPYAQVVNGPELSVAVSHELLEMLVDPFGDRFILAAAPASEPHPHHVFYLLEIADPCEIFTYNIDGTLVADFILPAFYNPSLPGPADQSGALPGPLQIPAGCFITWLDPIDGCWHQQGPDGSITIYDYIPGPSPRADRNAGLNRRS